MFEQIITDLVQQGLSESQIAARVGTTQPTINRLKAGQPSTKFETGQALIRLHRKVCGKRIVPDSRGKKRKPR